MHESQKWVFNSVKAYSFFLNLRILFNLKKLIKQCNKTKTKEKSKKTKELYIL